MPDLTIQCADCGEDFIFSEGESKFFQSKGFASPRRCKPCRAKKNKDKPRPQEEQRDERLA